jgi:hypothetical protein
MPASHLRFFLVDQGAVPFAINFLLNGAIAWALNREASEIPLVAGVATDTVATSFLLPLLTCLIVTPMLAKQVASGKLAPLAVTPPGVAGRLLGRGALLRGLALGGAGVVVAAGVVLVLLQVAPATWAKPSFLWFKAGYAAVLAALVTPVIAWLAIAKR